MRNTLAILVAVLCLLLAGTALAEDELSVVQTACNILIYGDECQVFCCAQVHNNSERIIGIQEGTLRLLSNEEVIVDDFVGRLWPYFLNPGEDGYLFQTVSFYPDENGELTVPTITGLSYSFIPMTTEISSQNEVLESEMEIEQSQGGSTILTCLIHNPGTETAWNPLVTYALYTSGGSMLYADGQSLDGIGLEGGSSLRLKFVVNSQIVSQWDSYGVEPAEVRVFTYYRTDDD